MTTPTLPVLDPTAAALDVGSETLHTSLAGDPPKIFGTTTGQLHALRDWLKENGVRTVAREAPGSYRLCPYEVLEQAGFAVVVVNGKDVKNLPGRKPDMQDCRWQGTLAHGLFKPGFVPPALLRRLPDYLRLRSAPLVMAGSHEQHMQKARERMNLKLHDVLSDLTGVSGRKLVEAILRGERNPAGLLGLCDPQIQKKKADRLRAALEGTWKAEHLFALRQAHELWRCYQQKIAECDQALEAVLKELAGPEDPQAPPPGGDQTRRSQRPADRGAAWVVVAAVRRPRPHAAAGRGRLCPTATAGRSGHGPGAALADRKARHGVAGAGAREQAKRPTAGPPEALAQPGWAAFLCACAQRGAQWGQGAGRVLPAAQGAARRTGGQPGAGAQARRTVLVPDGTWAGLCGRRTQAVGSQSGAHRTTPATKARRQIPPPAPTQDRRSQVGSWGGPTVP